MQRQCQQEHGQRGKVVSSFLILSTDGFLGSQTTPLVSLEWCGEGGGQTFLEGFFSWPVKETCLVNTFLKCSAAALKKNPTFYSTHSCLQRKMVCGKRKWLFLGSLTQLENTGEVLGTEPFLWLLSPIIALGCEADVQHTYSQKKKINSL